MMEKDIDKIVHMAHDYINWLSSFKYQVTKMRTEQQISKLQLFRKPNNFRSMCEVNDVRIFWITYYVNEFDRTWFVIFYNYEKNYSSDVPNSFPLV